MGKIKGVVKIKGVGSLCFAILSVTRVTKCDIALSMKDSRPLIPFTILVSKVVEEVDQGNEGVQFDVREITVTRVLLTVLLIVHCEQTVSGDILQRVAHDDC